MLVYFEKQSQIKDLLFNKAFIEISVKYSNYNNVFLIENVAKLPKNTKINKHIIKLKEVKQSLFDFRYSPGLVKLETLKTYIKTNLVNDFI